MTTDMQGKEVPSLATEDDSDSLIPRYSGCLDGTLLEGAANMESLWVEAGHAIACIVTARHPYVEWEQCYVRTHFWKPSPFVFPVLKKVKVSFGVRAIWNNEPLPGVPIVVDLLSIPRPYPPPPVPWEWCESLTSYAQRLLVRSALHSASPAVMHRLYGAVKRLADDLERHQSHACTRAS
jgi:hypothetical protein